MRTYKTTECAKPRGTFHEAYDEEKPALTVVAGDHDADVLVRADGGDGRALTSRHRRDLT